jgi:hypothetical protein
MSFAKRPWNIENSYGNPSLTALLHANRKCAAAALDPPRHLSIAKHRTLIVELYLKVTPISELPATWSQSHYAVSLAGHVAICLS